MLSYNFKRELITDYHCNKVSPMVTSRLAVSWLPWSQECDDLLLFPLCIKHTYVNIYVCQYVIMSLYLYIRMPWHTYDVMSLYFYACIYL